MANIYDMSDTWNDGLTTFNAIKMNVTDTASAADSLLMDLQVGGVSRAKVDKNGILTVNSTDLADSATLFDFQENGASKFRGTVRDGFTFSMGPSRAIKFTRDGTVFASIGTIGVIPRFTLGATGEFAWNPSNPPSGVNDLILTRDAANTLAQRNGANPQAFNLYNTYTDATEYERGFIRWNANVLEIGTEAAGVGTNRVTGFINSGQTVFRLANTRTEFLKALYLNTGAQKAFFDQYLGLSSGMHVRWSSGSDPSIQADAGLIRHNANIVRVTDGSTGTGDLILGNLTSTPTWNDANTAFTGMSMNVTDTASDAASLLMDLQVGGASKFKVDKSGRIFTAGSVFGGISSSSWIDIFPDARSTPSMRISFLNTRIGGINGGILEFCSGYASTAGDLVLARDAANTLAQRNGANPQAFNLYNTYTDATNYERGFMRWNADVLEIGTEAAGSGTARGILIRGADIDLWPYGGGSTTIRAFGAGETVKIMQGTTVYHTFNIRDFYPIQSASHLGRNNNGWGYFWIKEISSDPADPSEGHSVMWLSDGTGSGNDGDLMYKITANSVTKTAKIADSNDIANMVESDPTGVTGADAITNIISLTQAEYDAITPDASTLYVIV